MTTINAHLALKDLKSPAYALDVPVVNLNGSSKESLLNDYLAIMRALEAANKAMAEATPHGRDFQTVKNGDHIAARAREAFHERRAIIRAIHAEFEAVAVAISEQNDNRSPRKIPVPIVGGDPINDQLDIDIPPAAEKVEPTESIQAMLRKRGAEIIGGMKWTWAMFDDDEVGKAAFAEARRLYRDMEHRGYSTAMPDAANPNLRRGGFRFR